MEITLGAYDPSNHSVLVTFRDGDKHTTIQIMAALSGDAYDAAASQARANAMEGEIARRFATSPPNA